MSRFLAPRLIPEKADFRPALASSFLPDLYGAEMTDERLMRDMESYFQRAQKIRPLADAIRHAHDWKQRLRAIENYYMVVRCDIEATPCDQWAFDPYEVDWPMLFTPIEAALWTDIRQLGLALYPQYPVSTRSDHGPDPEYRTYYCDFASPARKVAIECDGKAFHNDPERDRERDRRLRLAGWTVYRFTGAQCREDFNETTLQRSTVSRELERIARLHFGPEDPRRSGSRVGGGFAE